MGRRKVENAPPHLNLRYAPSPQRDWSPPCVLAAPCLSVVSLITAGIFHGYSGAWLTAPAGLSSWRTGVPFRPGPRPGQPRALAHLTPLPPPSLLNCSVKRLLCGEEAPSPLALRRETHELGKAVFPPSDLPNGEDSTCSAGTGTARPLGPLAGRAGRGRSPRPPHSLCGGQGSRLAVP